MSEQQTNQNSGTDRGQPRSVSPYKAGLKCKCPICGEGRLYEGLLEVREYCETCRGDLSRADAGDGAQVFVILVLGALSTLLGVFLYSLGLQKWLMMTILVVVIIAGSVWMLRLFKAVIIALQFHHDARQGVVQEGDSNGNED